MTLERKVRELMRRRRQPRRRRARNGDELAGRGAVVRTAALGRGLEPELRLELIEALAEVDNAGAVAYLVVAVPYEALEAARRRVERALHGR